MAFFWGWVKSLKSACSMVMTFESLAFARLVVVDGVEELLVEVVPLFESVLLAKHARAHVHGDEGGLDEQGAATAHGVDEVGVGLPSRELNHAGGEHLVERRLEALLAVASAVERLAAGVEAQRALVFGNVHVEAYVGVGHADVGAAACALAELVNNGVFHLVADKLGVAELLGEHHRIYGKSLVVVQILAPVYLHHFGVNVVGAERLEVADGFEHLDGRVQLEVGAVEHFLVTCERHHAAPYLHIVGSQFGEFFCQRGLQAHERLGNDFKFCIVH